MDGMETVLVVPGAAVAAFCVWLTVRVINRREPWATAILIGVCLSLVTILLVALFPPEAAFLLMFTLVFPVAFFLLRPKPE